MTLCDECQAKSDKWLDYRVPRQLKISSGAAYDDTAAGVADARKARYGQWRTTIREQQQAIRRICQERHTANSIASTRKA
ncbi:hypothetical protein [Mycolicibacterium vinylchloridicum]|uniref:hypothetical protein n=1 Tax=Mycolicibacterium vinylchloridicum TaxID=2736928 RepID=UPI0015CAF876|nr:hypothetical protein [Mycolicibacterium vinylchloridicum]